MKYSVTVGIPAYNEGQNIKSLIKSILSQKQISFNLDKIIVINDNSVDDTEEKVKLLSKKYKKINLISDFQRKGKAERTNQLFQLNKSNILILFDGDVVCSDENVINNMLKNFKEEKVVLVGANKVPTNPESTIEKLITAWDWLWYEIRKDISNGNNVHNFSSCAFAIKKPFAKNLKCPTGPQSITKYLYFSAVQAKLKIAFAKDSTVIFRLPNNLHDYLSQIKRFKKTHQKNASLFGDWVYEYYKIPFKNKVKGTIEATINHPALTISSIVFHLIIRILPIGNSHYNNIGLWETVQSSKREIVL